MPSVIALLVRGALILLAATTSGFWARVDLSVFNDTILAVDAILVSLVVGSRRQGNFVLMQSTACASENIDPLYLASYLPQD